MSVTAPRCVPHPRTTSTAFSLILKRPTDINTGGLRHQQLASHLPVNYSFLAVKNMTSPTSNLCNKQKKQLSARQPHETAAASKLIFHIRVKSELCVNSINSPLIQIHLFSYGCTFQPLQNHEFTSF